MTRKTMMGNKTFVALVGAWTACAAFAAPKVAPYGVRLGERIAEPLPAVTEESLALFALTNDIARMRMPGDMQRLETVELSRPLMGVSSASVAVDHEGVGYAFTVSGSFRRGLAREESLRKIEALRADVERECGFRLNDYSFSASGLSSHASPSASLRERRSLRSPRTVGAAQPLLSRRQAGPGSDSALPDTVGGEGRGPELWTDLDRVYADSVTTHGDLKVAIRCRVNATSSAAENAASGVDSPVDVTVRFLLVNVLQDEEKHVLDGRRLVDDKIAASKSARIKEFCGVEFGKTLPPSSTNELTKTFYETWEGDDAEKKNRAKVHYWKRTIEDLKSTPIPFVDKLEAVYSLKTRTPKQVHGKGAIPAGLDWQEALKRLDEFASGLNRRYGILIDRGDADRNFVVYRFRNANVDVHIESRDGRVWVDITDESVRGIVEDEGRESLSEQPDVRESQSAP